MTEHTTIAPDLLQAALGYAAKGLPVFPCNPANKRPFNEHGFKDASTDAAQVEAWWSEWPSAMIGMPTGPASGTWVLDIDDPAAFEAACTIDLPATRRSVTGKGYHLFFAYDPATPVRNAQTHPKTGWPFPTLPGAEVRGDGGYVIVPPSRHPSGKLYTWESQSRALPAPAELLAIVTAGKKRDDAPPPVEAARASDSAYGLKALDDECATIRSAPEGAQEAALNEAALKIGALCAGRELSLDTARARLIAAGLAMSSYNSRDPWTSDMVVSKIERGLADGQRNPRSAPERMRFASSSEGDRAQEPDTRGDGPDYGYVDADGVWTAYGPDWDEPSDMGMSAEDSPNIIATPYQWCDPATIPLRPWIFGRWLLRRTVAAVVAPGGVGKTTFIAGAALSMVTGRELLGKTVWDGPQKVWIWNLEDGLEDMQRSIQAAALHHGVRREDVEGRLFVDCAMEGAGLCTAIEGPAGFKLLAPVYEQITAEIIKRSIDVLVVDPFVSSHEIEENANSLVDKVAKAWARVANDANCVVILVHHTSKAGASNVTAHSSRGAVALTDATRSALVLNRMDEKKAQELGFDDSEGKRYFSVGDDKHNRAPAEKADWFFLASVSLGNGPDGGDSVGVAQPAKLPDPFEDITVDDLRAVQSKVADGEWRENSQANDWVGKAVADVVGLDLERAGDKSKTKSLVKTWIANGALRVVERKDRHSETRKFVEVGEVA